MFLHKPHKPVVRNFYFTNEKGIFYNKLVIRNFSSFNPIMEKLKINLTFDNINFDCNKKSILIMPSLNEVNNLKEMRYNEFKQIEYISTNEVESVFFDQLQIIFQDLGPGKFSFEFYFYIESNSLDLVFDNIYNFVYFDDQVILKMSASYGFKKWMSTPLKIFEVS